MTEKTYPCGCTTIAGITHTRCAEAQELWRRCNELAYTLAKAPSSLAFERSAAELKTANEAYSAHFPSRFGARA